jgi:hypothetical protein
MKHTHPIHSLTDDELLHRLSEIVHRARRIEADLVAHIGEVDSRRLYAREACSSMFTYCTEVLHLSEHEAYERITAARVSRRYPLLLEMLREGRLHLSGIGKLAPHLTDENYESLLVRAAHKTKRQIEEILAELSPKPDVPPVVRKLPERAPQISPVLGELGPDRVKVSYTPEPSPPPAPPPARPVLQPLAPSRYKVQFTASGELREKLERLQALMRTDLAQAIEAAVTEKLERLEARRFGKTSAPRKDLEEVDSSPDSRYVPAPIRRAVSERDGDRCTFIDASGRRCTAREGLEFHHRSPYGRDGDHSVENLCLMCHAHNLYLAERDYGKDMINRYRRSGSSVREEPPEYGTGADFVWTPPAHLEVRGGVHDSYGAVKPWRVSAEPILSVSARMVR